MRAAIGLSCLSALGCAGGAPLMHPAHPMQEGEFTLGGGFSGQLAVAGASISPDEVNERILEEGAVAPGIAPWVGARLGIDGAIDGGVTYTGRSARADVRYAWDLGGEAFSLGLGLSGILPKRHGGELDDGEPSLRVGGFGGDVPVLFGLRSTADIYSFWIGARGGAELLRGEHVFEPEPLDPAAPIAESISGWHAYAGGLVGFRVGFRFVFAVIELDASMHWAGADIGETEVSVSQFALAPAGAIVFRF
jgi:hypothetical protein